MYHIVKVFNEYYTLLETRKDKTFRTSHTLMDLDDIIGKRSTFFTGRWKLTSSNSNLQEYLARLSGELIFSSSRKEKIDEVLLRIPVVEELVK